jgi:1-acyl-sn-glycerol-3-phosphate acyltransferase
MALVGTGAGRDNRTMEAGNDVANDMTRRSPTSPAGSNGRGADRAKGPLAPLVRRIEHEHSADAVRRDPEYIERQLQAVRRYTNYFSPEVRGIEYLPAEGPALLVGNHNALFYMPDTWVTALAIIDRRGTEHPAYTLTYDLLLTVPVVGPFLRRIGAIPAGSHEAEAALTQGALVLDYPGGDWEACRPWLDRNSIDFGGRTGFVRLALRTGVPVIPVVAHGSHDSVIVVSRGEGIARLLGLGAMRIKVFPIMLGPLGLATVLTPPPPLPTSITVEFLPPIHWSSLGPDAADDSEVVDRCAAEVAGVMQSALDRLRVERAHPLRRGITNLVSRAFSH